METLSRALEHLGRQSRVILSGEFAERVNILVGSLPDDYRIISLAGNWAPRYPDEFQKGPINPPEGYESFLGSLDPQEYMQLCRLWYRAIYVAGSTLGDVREWAGKTILPHMIGPRGKNFLFIASRKDPELVLDQTLIF